MHEHDGIAGCLYGLKEYCLSLAQVLEMVHGRGDVVRIARPRKVAFNADLRTALADWLLRMQAARDDSIIWICRHGSRLIATIEITQ